MQLPDGSVLTYRRKNMYLRHFKISIHNSLFVEGAQDQNLGILHQGKV